MTNSATTANTSLLSAGTRFRLALTENQPLPIVGTINPYCAMLAKHAGHKAIYLAGGGVGTYSYGLPDLAITTLNDLLTDVRRITDASDLPLLVDVDTGFGGLFNIARMVKSLIKDGAAAMHIEDQVQLKRCGHRPGKEVVAIDEMVDRIKASVDARTDDSFFIIARTDALAVEGLRATIDRACAYAEAGADMIFAEACTELEQYRKFVDALDRPHSVLANITEFSMTPGFTLEELRSVGVSAALYPLSAARAMAAAALRVYQAILRDGTQKGVLGIMQHRNDLYEIINYQAYEQKYDQLFAKVKKQP
ncbi:MAG: methylisocitrate lyase [Betaproteobacteria bacterium]|nr:methylisocitrate lyase [Betaproteobacteria bacterium]